MTTRELIELELIDFARKYPTKIDVRIAAQRVIDLAIGLEPNERCLCTYGPQDEIIFCRLHERKDQKSA